MQKKVQERDNELAELQQKEVEAQRQCEKLLLNQKSIDDLDKETLVKVMNSFRNKLVATNNEKKELQQVVAEAKNTIVKYKDLKSDYQTLEDAHLEQNKYIQSMKQKIGQVDKYQITIQTQEKIIAKMQSVIDSKFRGKSKLQDKQPIPDHANNFLEKSQLEEKERLLEAKEEELKIRNDRIEHLAGKVN